MCVCVCAANVPRCPTVLQRGDNVALSLASMLKRGCASRSFAHAIYSSSGGIVRDLSWLLAAAVSFCACADTTLYMNEFVNMYEFVT